MVQLRETLFWLSDSQMSSFRYPLSHISSPFELLIFQIKGEPPSPVEQNDTICEVKAVVEHSSKAPPTYAPEIPWPLLLCLYNTTAISSHILLSRENMKNAASKEQHLFSSRPFQPAAIPFWAFWLTSTGSNTTSDQLNSELTTRRAREYIQNCQRTLGKSITGQQAAICTQGPTVSHPRDGEHEKRAKTHIQYLRLEQSAVINAAELALMSEYPTDMAPTHRRTSSAWWINSAGALLAPHKGLLWKCGSDSGRTASACSDAIISVGHLTPDS